MTLFNSNPPAEGYQIFTEVYEGPLDLLLELIERAELDITQLALAQVTDQYLAYLNQLLVRDAAEVSSFLVIAARLLQIKSSALLPRPALEPLPGEDIDDGEALAQQLILYKRFKEIAQWLTHREELGLHTYLRLAPPPKIQGKLDLSGVTINDLALAARQIFVLGADMEPLSEVVSKQRITIRERIRAILDAIRRGGHTTFQSVLSKGHPRIEVVVTFLALLELIKRNIVEARQAILFGEIDLEPLNEWSEDESEQLEFEE